MSPETLVEQYTPLIHREAYRALRRMPQSAGYTVEDLVQEGWAQALYSADRWDPARLKGVKSERAVFISYLTMTLRNRYGRLAEEWWARHEVQVEPVDLTQVTLLAQDQNGLLEAILDAERPGTAGRTHRLAMVAGKYRKQAQAAVREARLIASLPDRYAPQS